MAAPKEKDFGKIEKQVSSYKPSREPDDLRPLDEAHGGIPVPHKIITDENFRSGFKKEKEHTAKPVYYNERGK